MNFEIILASKNKHKLQEVREILSPHGIIVYSPNDLNLKIKDAEENGKTYFENALIKAKAVQEVTTMPILADDSGLEVESLNNEPGMFSARYASQLGGNAIANLQIINRLKEFDNKKARFICDIVLLNTSPTPLKFEGEILGEITDSPKGNEGFGYDPIFFIKEENKTFAELPKEIKNKISHRAKALKKLVTYLKISNYIKK